MKAFFFKIILLILSMIQACNPEESDQSSNLQQAASTIAIAPHAKKGDCFLFADNNGMYFAATAIRFEQIDGELWYMMCFTNYCSKTLPDAKAIDTLKLYAVKVPFYSLNDHTVGFQVSWVRDTIIDRHKKKLLGTMDMQGLDDMEPDAGGFAYSYADFLHEHDFYGLLLNNPEKYYLNPLDSALRPNFLITVQEAKAWQLHNEALRKRYE